MVKIIAADASLYPHPSTARFPSSSSGALALVVAESRERLFLPLTCAMTSGIRCCSKNGPKRKKAEGAGDLPGWWWDGWVRVLPPWPQAARGMRGRGYCTRCT